MSKIPHPQYDWISSANYLDHLISALKRPGNAAEKQVNKELQCAASFLEVCRQWQHQNPEYLASETHSKFCLKLHYKHYIDSYITRQGEHGGSHWFILSGKVGHYIPRDLSAVKFENDVVFKLIDYFGGGRNINEYQLASLVSKP